MAVGKGAVCLSNGGVWKQRQQRQLLMTLELRRLEERGRREEGGGRYGEAGGIDRIS